MANYLASDTDLTSVADAIRAKGGTSAELAWPSGFISAVQAISGGGGITPTGTKQISIAANGTTTTDVTSYANAEITVNVPGPSGTKQISVTQNGTTTEDVAAYASAQIAVNVPNSYAAADEGKVVSNGALVAQTSDTVTQNGTVDTTLINSLTVNVSGGGGGSGETLLASGTYTLVSAGEMTIPVTYTGTPTKACVIGRDPVSGTAQVNAWLNGNLTTPSELLSAFGSQTTICRQMAANGNITYVPAQNLSVTASTIVCSKLTGAYHPAALTYDWYIWGYTT